MTAKTTAERQDSLVKRREAAGLKLLRNLWAHPDDHGAIKNYTLSLTKARDIAAKKPT